MNDKLIIVVGSTASGKSELAVALAKKYNGEIISADSRQVYRGLDIGTGKVSGKWAKGMFLYKEVLHHLIDEANPKRQYSVFRYSKKARSIINDVIKRGHLPIICGGTAHWIDAVAYGQVLPEVKPNSQLRNKLAKLTTIDLYKKLQNLDPDRAAEIDPHNTRRLIRAIEIVMATGKPVPKVNQTEKYNTLWLGIKLDQKKLETKIQRRLKQRLRSGMIDEVKRLRKSLSWKRLESFGLEYKFIALFLQQKLSKQEMEQQLFIAIKRYAKRQMTWWKRNPNIHWSDKTGELKAAAKRFILLDETQ